MLVETLKPVFLLSENDFTFDRNESFICSDGSCIGNPGDAEYRITDETGKIIYNSPVFHGTNNAAEFLGLVHACKIARKRHEATGNKVIVYTDSDTALSWFIKNGLNTKKLKYAEKGLKIAEVMMIRANNIAQLDDFTGVEVRSWKTRLWGEIPADFGRKFDFFKKS